MDVTLPYIKRHRHDFFIERIRGISEGFKIIILTVAIAGFAAWKFPVQEEKQEQEGGAEE